MCSSKSPVNFYLTCSDRSLTRFAFREEVDEVPATAPDLGVGDAGRQAVRLRGRSPSKFVRRKVVRLTDSRFGGRRGMCFGRESA